jgi:hypothetical protein
MAVFVTAIVVAVEAVGTSAFIGAALTAVAETGMALSVVGAVTGNKNLMKIGGEMGLVGGLGSLAAGAFSAAGGAAAEGVGEAVGNAGASFSDAAFDATGAAGTAAGGVAGSEAAAATNALGGLGDMGGDAMSTTGSSMSQPLTIDPGAAGAEPWNASDDLSNAGMSDTVNGQNGTYDASGKFIPDQNTGAAQTDTGSVGAPNGVQAPSGANAPSSPGMSAVDSIKQSLGDMWGKMSPQAQSELMKAALAVPGGIQNQKNRAAELALQQQKVNQTSYGSQVPSFGIINSAQKAG